MNTNNITTPSLVENKANRVFMDAPKDTCFMKRVKSMTCLTALLTLCLIMLLGCGPKQKKHIFEELNALPVAELRAKAEKGDAIAQSLLGDRYYRGQGVAEDKSEAEKWFRAAAPEVRKAAEKGNAPAQIILGNMYADGLVITKDMTEAVKWLRKAAEQGDVFAQSQLGFRYAFGADVDKDNAEAAKWLRKASEQGNVNAQLMLGNMYADGEGVDKDNAEAAKWFRKADQGNSPSTPSEVVRAWADAIQTGNYLKANSLSAADSWAEMKSDNRVLSENHGVFVLPKKIIITGESISGDTAVVGLEADRYGEKLRAIHMLKENGAWKIRKLEIRKSNLLE